MKLSEDHRSKLVFTLLGGISLIAIIAAFFLGILLVNKNINPRFFVNDQNTNEVFGFAPYWNFSKLNNVDWKTLTTFAYFSIPVNSDGTFDETSAGYSKFKSKQLSDLYNEAHKNNVRRVVTLTQMDQSTIVYFLNNSEAQNRLTRESIKLLAQNNLDGVNIDFEYIGRNNNLRQEFSDFVFNYSKNLKANLNNPYITVSVIASSEKDHLIYDVGSLAKSTDGIFIMAYDFYYPGSEKIGPSAPLYGYDNGHGPFWYDVSSAVDDFLKVADSRKIILGVPYYGWNYPAPFADPKIQRSWGNAFATTNEAASEKQLIATTPTGGWDNQAHVAWRGYFDNSGWHVVYVEDKKSLGEKYDFAKSKNLAGVGIWALGYDNGDSTLSTVLAEKFPKKSNQNKI